MEQKAYLCFMLAKHRALYLPVFHITKDKTRSGEVTASDEY